ncbi:MAG: TatD family hydrolase [Candidatus Levybacteria bacterium]|nr:TatD family hydrolase [Candidatus Levybacteria bacterium]
MIDVHCHLNFRAFANDYDQVIKQAEKDGVKKIINVGTSIESSLRAVELANKYPNLYAIVGIHPHHADKVKQGWDAQIEKIAKSSKKVVAIGEVGLDYYSYASNGIVEPKLQRHVFERQIEIANDLNLPLQIHNRQAGNDIFEIINLKSSIINQGGMFHCMSGNLDLLNEVLALGFYVGFDGNITYKGIAKGETTPLPDLVREAPIEQIVTETDSPYLPPEPHRGSRNMPVYVILVTQEIAKIKGLDPSVVKAQTTLNAKNLFKL